MVLWLFTYFLKNKSDSVKATNKFIADIAPYGKVKTWSFHDEISLTGDVVGLKSDNGGDYLSKYCKDLSLKHDIKRERSSPNSPYQNGTAERSWHTLFDMGRSFLADSGLLKFLLAFAIMDIMYTRIINMYYI